MTGKFNDLLNKISTSSIKDKLTSALANDVISFAEAKSVLTGTQ